MRLARGAAPLCCLVTLGLAVSACRPSPVPGAVVESQALRMSLLDDGSALVREQLRVRFGPGGITEWRRVVPPERADTFFDVTASLDGRALPPAGAGPRTVTVDRDGDLDVTWHFPAASDTTHEFTLEYRAAGVVSRVGNRGRLRWPVLPLHPAYPVVASEVHVDFPKTSVLLERPAFDGPGWTVTLRADGFDATGQGFQADARAGVDTQFSVDGLGIGEPDWQFRAAREVQFAPAWASSGLFMVVVAFGVIWMLRFQYKRGRRPAAGPPDGAVDLDAPIRASDPAVVVVLRNRRRIRGGPEWRAAVAGLAERGPEAAPRNRHEQVVADARWLEGKAVAVTVLPSAGVLRRFRAALGEDLVEAGLVDPERLLVATGLRAGGWTTVAVGAVVAATTPWLLAGFGRWPYALPAGLVAGGLILVVYATRWSILTDAGERQSAAG